MGFEWAHTEAAVSTARQQSHQHKGETLKELTAEDEMPGWFLGDISNTELQVRSCTSQD